MSCEYWRRQIALHMEGEVSPRKSRQVENHLDTCLACRQFARELGQSQAVLKGLGHEPVDGRVFEAIQDRVMDRLTSGREQVSQTLSHSIHWNWRWTGAMTVGLLLLLGGLAFWKSSRELQPVSNGRLAGPAAHSEKNSNGQTSTQVGNQVGARAQMTEKARAVQKHRLGKMLRKPPNRSRESTVRRAEKLSNEDGRPVGSQPEEGKASSEVAQAGSQEVKTGINPEVTVGEPLVIKLVTDDPEIVIVWLVDQNGGLKK